MMEEIRQEKFDAFSRVIGVEYATSFYLSHNTTSNVIASEAKAGIILCKKNFSKACGKNTNFVYTFIVEKAKSSITL